MRVTAALLLSLLAASLQAQTVSYFRIDGVSQGIASGPDGNLWFPIYGGIVKMTTSGSMTTFPTPVERVGHSIANGPDGRMWYTMPGANAIGAITTSGAITEYPLPANTRPYGITGGADGNVWFGYAGGVGRMTTAGAVTLFPFDPPVLVPSEVYSIVEGPDGNFWFTDYRNGKIGRITPAGVVTRYDTCCGGPYSIARGNDGALWFVPYQGNRLGRISTDGAITYRELPSAMWVNYVANGPGATIWFTTHGGLTPAIGRLGFDGEIHTVPLQRGIPLVNALTPGVDGNMWAALYPQGQGCTLDCPPPTRPELGIVRVNLAGSHLGAEIPTVSETLLALLAVALAGAAILRVR